MVPIRIDGEERMPSSYPEDKPYAAEFIGRLNPKTVLDVGPGVGTYGKMIRGKFDVEHLNAVEVWAPYIETYRLREIYDDVFVCDVRYWRDFKYDLVILGDVLEHLALPDAIDLWTRISMEAGAALLVLPIVHYPQGTVEGNPFETHLEPNWSTEKVLRYLPGIQEYREFPVSGAFTAVFQQCLA